MDGRPNCRNKAASSSFSGGVGTFPEPDHVGEYRLKSQVKVYYFDRLNARRIPTLTDWNENTRLVW